MIRRTHPLPRTVAVGTRLRVLGNPSHFGFDSPEIIRKLGYTAQ